MIPKEHLYDNTHTTSNSGQIELLKKHFPNCFDKNGAFIPHKMSEVVGQSALELSKESYSLNWLGKSYARLLANEIPFTLLREDKEHNQKEANQNSENLLIKGDNLEVLKHLKNAYSESIKMIYIDPPYNTGGDGFVYNDDRKFTPEQLMRLAGIELDEAKRILEFTASKANSHSAWLTFMYPRLYIARELLKEDGVIFISIDDNEQAQLKLLCDEVFGEENFVGELSIVNNIAGRSDSKDIAQAHEYALIYQKTNEFISYGIELSQAQLDEYKFSDKVGKYRKQGLRKRGSNSKREDRPNMYYPIYFDIENKQLFLEKNSLEWIEILPKLSDGSDGCWRWGKDTFEKKIDKLEVNYVNTRKEYDIFEKVYLIDDDDDIKTKKLKSFLLDSKYTSDKATTTLRELLPNKIFTSPKPIDLIKDLIINSCHNDELILDFFAGSGTTAHAVMDLNAQDNGNRKFICVQLAELTDPKSEAHKAGYTTIFDITKARIEKASEKIKKEISLLNQNMDLGFKIFETMPLFEGYLDDMEELNAEQTLFDGSLLDDEALAALLVTWKVYDGQSLTASLQRVSLSTYTAYLGGKNLYLMHKGFDMDALKAFIAKLDSDKDFNPSKIVLFGYNFESKTQRELKEAMSVYTNKKAIELDIVVRY